MSGERDSQSDAIETADPDLPIPHEGVIVTHLLIVRDVARSRQFYSGVLGARAAWEGPRVILRFHNSWLILSEEGVSALAPRTGTAMSNALNLRVADIHETYERWRAAGAEFRTPSKEHQSEIRCYLRGPDGHLIEVGQTTARKETNGRR